MGRMMRRVKCALNKFLSRFIMDYLVLSSGKREIA